MSDPIESDSPDGAVDPAAICSALTNFRGTSDPSANAGPEQTGIATGTPVESDQFAEGHRLGYEAGLRAGSLPDGEVARVLLPLGVTALSKVVDGLEKHFGDDLRMMQRGDWLIFIKPNTES